MRYEWFAGKMKSAIQKAILQAVLLPDHLMGAYVLAFAFDLVPDELQENYKKKLIDWSGNMTDVWIPVF